MKLGKLTNEELNRLVLQGIQAERPDVVLRPGIGLDCGGVAFGEEVCILSTDPITAAEGGAGALAVHICCNDVAAAGAEPVGMLLTIMAPPDACREDIARVVAEAQEAASRVGVEIVGGHTEVTDAVNRMVLSATVVGRAPRDRFFSAAGARPGDAILMTKWAGMEGTAILAHDFADRLSSVLTPEELQGARALTQTLSVVPEGLLARNLPVTSMHDITEGGVLGAVWEMAEASGCGALLNLDHIPVLKVTRRACAHLGLNPYRLISSGSMLMTASDGAAVAEALLGEGIPASIIGCVTQEGIQALTDGQAYPVEPPGSDELYKVRGNP